MTFLNALIKIPIVNNAIKLIKLTREGFVTFRKTKEAKINGKINVFAKSNLFGF